MSKDNRSPIRGTWRGRDKYTCRICGWDTVEGRDKFVDHVRHAHPPLEIVHTDPPAPKPVPAVHLQPTKEGDQ